jgi:hypothetical protein
MHFTENFQDALQDYTLLINKKYPEKTVLEMVATRYSLNHFERSFLYRGISTTAIAEKRKKKLITIEQVDNRTLHVDLFNVLFTIAAYLRGFPVYIANDGMVRDASESHGKGDWEVHLEQGLELMIDHFPELILKESVLYIDNLLEYGLAISEKIRQFARIAVPAIKIISDPSPDHLLKAATEGVIATSDSTIIDKTSLPVFDLAHYILQKSFHPELLTLTSE